MKLNTLRPRRLRRTAAIRSMVRENSLELNDFVYPIFVVPGTNVKEEIPSMPGQYHLSVDNAVKMAEEVYKLGIPAVEIFGLPEYKDDKGSSAWDMTSPVQRAEAAIKKAVRMARIPTRIRRFLRRDMGHSFLRGSVPGADAALFQHGQKGQTLGSVPLPPPAAGGLRLRRPTRRTCFLFHRARRIFFLMSQKENGGCVPAAVRRVPLRSKENVRNIPMGKAHLGLQFRMVPPCSLVPHSGTFPSQFINQFMVNQKERSSWQSI